MNNVSREQHEKLITVITELLHTISELKNESKDYLLIQNENEARDWLLFLKNHMDKEELRSLESEIANRFVYKFDVQISNSELDTQRANLMKNLMILCSEYLK